MEDIDGQRVVTNVRAVPYRFLFIAVLLSCWPLTVEAQTSPGSASAEPSTTVAATPAVDAQADAQVDAQADDRAEPPVRVRAALGDGVVLTSGDGRFSIGMRGRIQARAAVTAQDDDARVVFMVRRLRFTIFGHVGSNALSYQVQLGVAPLDFEPGLLNPIRDAFMTYSGLRDAQIRVGQMKVPFSRERITSSASLQFVDRSIVNAELNLDRDIGLQLFSRNLFGTGWLAYALGVFGGEGRNRAGNDAGLLYVARLEVMPFGPMDDAYAQVDHVRSSAPRMAIGAAAGFNHRTRRLQSTIGEFAPAGSFDYLHATGDVSFKVAGLSLEAGALMRRAIDGAATGQVDGQATTTAPRNVLGWLAQAGYLFAAPIEIAARYSELHPLDGADAQVRTRREAAGALSWYASEHDLKLQLDYTYQFGAGLGDGQHEARLQAQLAY